MEHISDAVFVFFVLFCAYRGYRRGIFLALLSAAGFIGGYAAVYMFSAPVGDFMTEQGWFPVVFSRPAASMAIFGAVGLVVAVLSSFIDRFLTPKDGTVAERSYRAAGAVIGGGAGVLYGSLVALISLFVRASYAEAKSEPFSPNVSETISAAGAKAAFDVLVSKKDRHPAVEACYIVVSDPEKGMSRVKQKLHKRIKGKTKDLGGIGGGQAQEAQEKVEEILSNPEIKKRLKAFN